MSIERTFNRLRKAAARYYEADAANVRVNFGRWGFGRYVASVQLGTETQTEVYKYSHTSFEEAARMLRAWLIGVTLDMRKGRE